MLEGKRMRTYDCCLLLHKANEDFQHRQDHDNWVGKIQRSTFGTGVDHWKRGKTLRSARRQFTTTGGCAHVHTQHENGARPRLHAASSAKRAKLWGSKSQVYSGKCESVNFKVWVPRVQVECGVPSVECEVWSVERGVWGVKCDKTESVKCGV